MLTAALAILLIATASVLLALVMLAGFIAALIGFMCFFGD